MEKSYFCQQICCLLCCEYWIMVTQTTDSKKRGWETLCFIYFFTNWIFPFGKHETSLGILRVKPELFSSFLSFLRISLAGSLFTLSKRNFHFFPPFIPSMMMIKSIHKRAERRVSSRVEKTVQRNSTRIENLLTALPEKKCEQFSIFRPTLKRFQIPNEKKTQKTWKWNSKKRKQKTF